MPPVLLTAFTAGLVALIPKALTDAYDYFFNGEEIQIKKVPDKTTLSKAQEIVANRHYQRYLIKDGTYTSQKDLTHFLNVMFDTNKSIAQMMRICRSSE